jgi:diguanylate cyclase (GGDEF)-like protein
VRPRSARPRSLSAWLLRGLALVVLPPLIVAVAGITAQQRELSHAREAGHVAAARVAIAAHIQVSVEVAEDVARRATRTPDPAVAPRVRAALIRARSDLTALHRLPGSGTGEHAVDREFATVEPLVARLGTPRADIGAASAALSRLDTATALLTDDLVATMRSELRRDRSGQHTQLIGILIALTFTLIVALLVARRLVASIRRPLAALSGSARRLGSGDLAHRVELNSFSELDQVADSFNAMATRLRQSRHELSHRAFHDSLTSLPNRALLFDRIAHALARGGSTGDRPSIGVLFVDIDDFKGINDSMGHSHGDDALVEIGRRIGSVLRPSDTVARLGGDEFAVLLDDLAEPAAATRVAERILLLLSTPVRIADAELDVGASIGVAVSSDELHDSDTLVRAADLAMYAAKGAGKGRYRAFDSSMLSGAVERLSLERDLKLAVERDEIELHYQPVLDLVTGRARGVEALARWTHPTRGAVGPDVFIPLAEQIGLIVPLGRQLLTHACDALPALRTGLGETELLMAVNLSAAQLLDPALPDDLRRSVAAAGITTDSLMLEITESQLITDLDAGVARLHELKTLGVYLALDDFGTGYSSLAYLRSFPVDSLKVDKAFIDNVADTTSDDHALVRAIISLGQTLEVRVVAEGIEHQQQRVELQRIGCDRGQGYLFARPMPAAALIAAFGSRLLV